MTSASVEYCPIPKSIYRYPFCKRVKLRQTIYIIRIVKVWKDVKRFQDIRNVKVWNYIKRISNILIVKVWNDIKRFPDIRNVKVWNDVKCQTIYRYP